MSWRSKRLRAGFKFFIHFDIPQQQALKFCIHLLLSDVPAISNFTLIRNVNKDKNILLSYVYDGRLCCVCSDSTETVLPYLYEKWRIILTLWKANTGPLCSKGSASMCSAWDNYYCLYRNKTYTIDFYFSKGWSVWGFPTQSKWNYGCNVNLKQNMFHFLVLPFYRHDDIWNRYQT